MRQHIKNFALAIIGIAIASTAIAATTATSAFLAVTDTTDVTAETVTQALPELWSKYSAQVGLALFIIISVINTVQVILKAIPTEQSIKMQGIVGKIADLLTFFQKDILKTPVKIILLFVGLSLLSGCYATKDCRLTNPVMTNTSQTICLECDSLSQHTLDYLRTKFSPKQSNPKL